jgi:hypothetical protein
LARNIGVDKILGSTEFIAVDKILASTKYWRQQNIGVDKILALTNYLRRQNVGRRRRISLLFGSAESTAADFSQTSLKISYVSLMVLIPLHAVAKCGISSGRPAFMGGLSPVLYRLILPGTLPLFLFIFTLI